MESLEASCAAKRRRLALGDSAKGKMELDALWSQLRSELGEMEHHISGLACEDAVGLAAEAKPSDQKAKETPAAEVAAEHSPPPSKEQKPYLFRLNNLAKQSGVPYVGWNSPLVAWLVKFPKLDSKGKKLSWTNRTFSVKKFMGPGIAEAQADAAALEAAKAFRAELVKQGILSEPKPKDPNCTSEVPGVKWNQKMQKWKVEICPKGGGKNIFGGYFTEKAAAEAKALWLMEKDGLQRRVKPVAALSELPVFHPRVLYPGVKWNQGEQQWHATCNGGLARFRVKPKDHSEAELERSFQVAVAWKMKMKKEKDKKKKKEAKIAKPKAKPTKK